MYGGILGFAGLVLAIIAAAKQRAQRSGIAAFAIFVIAWIVNSVAAGHL